MGSLGGAEGSGGCTGRTKRGEETQEKKKNFSHDAGY